MIMVSIREIPVEKHPWPPFLPANARILMLGSFPPKPERWCMDFFYPNWLNDMWRIMGEIFYADKDYFTELPDYKRFDRRRIEIFLREKGIALYDTATEVRRLKDNASDKFLEVVRPTDWRDFIVCHRLPGHIRWPCQGKPRSMLLCLGRKVFCRRKQRAFLTLFRRFTVLNNSE